MKRRIILFWLAAYAAVSTGVVASELPPAKPTLATLEWMAGAWTFERNGRVVEEQWLAPAGGTMLGMGRTVADGKTVEHEFLLLREEAGGEIRFTSKPAVGPETSFKLAHASDFVAVFENLAQDFPQRIRYDLQVDGSLLVAMEGKKDGRERRVVIPYRHVKP